MIKVEKITEEQKKNLARLSAYLKIVPTEKFDMGRYAYSYKKFKSYEPYKLTKKYHNCDTVACAAGHGPMAGLYGKEGEEWKDYVERVFGLQADDNPLYTWFFAGSWDKTDNTAKGAAARIDYYLKNNGIPLNYLAQKEGDAELCYKVSSL